jgi:hypothetical protein
MSIEYALESGERARLTRGRFLFKTSEGGSESVAQSTPAAKPPRHPIRGVRVHFRERGRAFRADGVMLNDWRFRFPAGGTHADLP